MRDRLIELLKETFEYTRGVCIDFDEAAEINADHLLASGVIVPPVNVGQKVWYIHGGYYNSARKEPREIEITEINQKRCKKELEWAFIANGTRYKFSSIGKTVFLTRKEAERALKGEHHG